MLWFSPISRARSASLNPFDDVCSAEPSRKSQAHTGVIKAQIEGWNSGSISSLHNLATIWLMRHSIVLILYFLLSLTPPHRVPNTGTNLLKPLAPFQRRR